MFVLAAERLQPVSWRGRRYANTNALEFLDDAHRMPAPSIGLAQGMAALPPSGKCAAPGSRSLNRVRGDKLRHWQTRSCVGCASFASVLSLQCRQCHSRLECRSVITPHPSSHVLAPVLAASAAVRWCKAITYPPVRNSGATSGYPVTSV